MACGQKPEGRAYWTEYAFCDLPIQGPGRAKGLVLWSHGVAGKTDEYRNPAPPFVRKLAHAGWDVVKVNRNGLHESCAGGGSFAQCWVGGARHVDDLVQRTRQAQAQGYARIVAAGQSFGGAISAEANAKAPGLFHAVIATSPGHGSDAGSGSSTRGVYYTLDQQLLDVLQKQRSGRIVISLPPGDQLHPNRYGDPIGPKVNRILVSSGLAFVQFDESLPISGHGAARTNQFAAWFGDCLREFVDPARMPPPGQTRCPPPSPLPAFLLPVALKVPTAGTAGLSRLLGWWQGTFDGSRAEVAVVVQEATPQRVSLIYASGAGPNRNLSMATEALMGTAEGQRIQAASGSVTYELVADGDRLVLTRHPRSGDKDTAVLIRQARG